MHSPRFHHLAVEFPFHQVSIDVGTRSFQTVVAHLIAEIFHIEGFPAVSAVISLFVHGAIIGVVEQIPVCIIKVGHVLERRCRQEQDLRRLFFSKGLFISILKCF